MTPRKVTAKPKKPAEPLKAASVVTTITNADIATELERVADLLDIQGENPFKVRAYRNAARMIRGHGEALTAVVARGDDLTELPHIGKDMAAYITEFVTTGHLKRLEDLEKTAPTTLVELMQVAGLGPKRAQALWKELGITSVADLEKAAQEGRIASLPRFGTTTEQKILESLHQKKAFGNRFTLLDAEQNVQLLIEHLHRHPAVKKLEVAGSYRRRKETVGDIDILVVSDRPDDVMEHFTGFPRVAAVDAKGGTRSTIRLQSGLQVDLRVIPEKSFGAALVYFTGSKEHNIRLRARAEKQGLRISEYGVFKHPARKKKAAKDDPWAGQWLAGRAERDVYAAVGLAWIPPELREDRGEIDAAAENSLPRLVARDDMRGDLQMHTTWSDGKDSVDEMVEACAQRGYEYMAITDHGPALHMVKGLDPERLKPYLKEVEKVQAKHPEIRLLRSMEVDIHADGTLDMPDAWLERLDLVVVSIHSHFTLPAAEQTRRIVAALRHPCAHVLGHPTGRILNKRPPMQFDMDEVLRCAADHNVAVEINAQPDRLDLNEGHLFRARELGVKVVISTDAHATEHLAFMRYGVDQARRAWLTKRDVLNTLPLPRFLKALQK